MRSATALILAALLAAPALGDGVRPDRPDDAAWVSAFERGDPAAARDRLAELIRTDPTNAILVYNLACAEAMLGNTNAAIESLLDALAVGFVDLFHMERDGRLDAIRDHPAYRRGVASWRRLLDARLDAELTALRTTLTDDHVQLRDAERRIAIVAALGEEELADVERQVDRVADCLGDLFPAVDHDPDRPDPWVVVLIPTPEDYALMVRSGAIAGYFDRDTRKLVTRDIGPTLRHELVHALHWRLMDRLGQRHPVWIQEGLASLHEDLGDGAVDGCAFAPSWRTNITRRLARAGSLTPWRDLFAMDNAAFLGPGAQANYAQARSVLRFLSERGVLDDWHDDLIRTSSEDPSGMASIGRALGVDPSEAERSFRAWARSLEPAPAGRGGAATLGVPLSAGRGLGPVVDLGDDPVARFRAGRTAGVFRHGDVILAIDGRSTRTLHELARALAGAGPGDVVVVTIGRGDDRVDAEVPLVGGEYAGRGDR